MAKYPDFAVEHHTHSDRYFPTFKGQYLSIDNNTKEYILIDKPGCIVSNSLDGAWEIVEDYLAKAMKPRVIMHYR